MQSNMFSKSRSPRSVAEDSVSDASTLVGLRYSMTMEDDESRTIKTTGTGISQISTDSFSSALSVSTFDQSTTNDDISSFGLYDDISSFALSLGSNYVSEDHHNRGDTRPGKSGIRMKHPFEVTRRGLGGILSKTNSSSVSTASTAESDESSEDAFVPYSTREYNSKPIKSKSGTSHRREESTSSGGSRSWTPLSVVSGSHPCGDGKGGTSSGLRQMPNVSASTNNQRDHSNGNSGEERKDVAGGGSNSNSPKTTVKEDPGRQIHEMAAKHLQRGELDEALKLFEEILTHQREQQKTSVPHRGVGAALHNVAVVHIKAKRFEKALSVMQEAVTVRRKTLGPNHRDLASSLVKLGSIQISLKDCDAANEAFQEALRIRRQLSLGKPSVQIAQVLSQIGLLHFEIGELLAAVTAFEEALFIYRTLHQQEGGAPDQANDNISETLSNIGTIRSKRIQFDRAIVALEECMMLQTLQFGEEHPTVLHTVDQLAYAYCKYGSHENALELYKQMLRAQINKHGATDMICCKTLTKMSIVHEKQKDYCAAMECTGQVLAIQRRHLDYDHPDLLTTKKTFSRMEKQARIIADEE